MTEVRIPRGAVTPHETFIPLDGATPLPLIIAELEKGARAAPAPAPAVPKNNEA